MRSPVHQDIPELFLPACSDLFTIPMDEERLFVARTWVEKPLQDGSHSPACWLISACRLTDAHLVSQSVQSILNWIWTEASTGRLTTAEINAILYTVRRRVRLLHVEEAISVFGDLGIPVFFPPGQDINEVLIIPFVPGVGFSEEHVRHYRPQVPNK